MKRLSLVDALFLYMETPETPMHVASVTIFKPTSPRDDLFGARRSSGGWTQDTRGNRPQLLSHAQFVAIDVRLRNSGVSLGNYLERFARVGPGD